MTIKKNEVFPKGFWTTFAKVVVSEAKPANSIEKRFLRSKKRQLADVSKKHNLSEEQTRMV